MSDQGFICPLCGGPLMQLATCCAAPEGTVLMLRKKGISTTPGAK